MLLWASYSDQWKLNHKVTFDGVNKRIYIAPDVQTLDVKQDIYSDWKEWMQLYDNAKFLPAFRSIGGDPVGDGQFAGDIYFLINGWQIVIDHLVTLTGTLYQDDGLSPFIVLAGGGVIATVSNLSFTSETSAAGLTPEQELLLNRILKDVKTAIALSA
jgi:hypothetical protein